MDKSDKSSSIENMWTTGAEGRENNGGTGTRER